MPRRLIVLASLVLACGPDPAATDTATTVAEASTTPSDTSTGDPSTSDAPTGDTPTSDTPTSTAETTQTGTTGTTDPGTTGTATTEPAATSTGDSTTGDTSTTDATDATSTGDGTTTDSTTGEDDVQYAAFFWAGGLDHLLVHRADFTNDRCTTIHFAWPGGVNPDLAITAPNDWAAADARTTMGTAGCLAGEPLGAEEYATGGSGAATWQQDPNEYCPPQIDLDLVLDFPPGMPWVPAQEHMFVTALPVQNCP